MEVRLSLPGENISLLDFRQACSPRKALQSIHEFIIYTFCGRRLRHILTVLSCANCLAYLNNCETESRWPVRTYSNRSFVWSVKNQSVLPISACAIFVQNVTVDKKKRAKAIDSLVPRDH